MKKINWFKAYEVDELKEIEQELNWYLKNGEWFEKGCAMSLLHFLYMETKANYNFEE